MAIRFLVYNPNQMRTSLIVDVVDRADAAAVARVRKSMHGKGCANGLVVDETEMLVLRDTFSSMEESAIEVEFRLLTKDLLSGKGTLARQVEVWMDRVRSNWHAAIPHEASAAKLLYDVVPALAAAEIDRIEPTAA